MGLLNGQDLLDNHEFFIGINFIKYRVCAGDVKPVNDEPAL